jgi:hypothetical protein
MKTLLIVIAFTAFAFGQDCTHTNLSKEFDVAVSTKWYGSDAHTLSDSLDVIVSIINKKTQASQQIHFGSSWMFEDAYGNCNYVRSYTTGFNKTNDSGDNDFGDIVVADFNFDGHDDVAFKQNAGGNAGPSYYFYIQDESGRFILSDFLTGTMGYFPEEIIPSEKQLVTKAHANAYQYRETTYRYDAKTKQYTLLKSELKDWD